MPCLGDFVSRRLPPEFIAAWDTWLQRSVAASRTALGESWTDVFLTSPMWRFVLAPGACGTEARAGLLLPSVDKVGRYFPMTFALAVPPPELKIPRLIAAHEWYEALEHVALSALNVDFSPEELEAALARHRYGLAAGDDQGVSGQDMIRCRSRGVAEPQSFHLDDARSLGSVVNAAARAALAQAIEGHSFWWCVEPDSGAAEIHSARGLPADDYFVVLMRGAGPAQPTGEDTAPPAGAAPA
jgi:type VI secretion system protein ImpM